MDPINSWVDAAALRKLAESLVAPHSEPEMTPEVAYGPTFVGFEKAAVRQKPAPPMAASTPVAPSRSENQARTALAGARQLAEQGGILGRAPEQRTVTRTVEPSPVPRPQAVVTPNPAPASVARNTPAPTPAPPSRPPAPPLLTPAPPSRPPAPPLLTPVGLFMERLRAYGNWLHASIGAKAFFVADRDGELLIDEVHSMKLLQVARTLAQASWTANRQAGGEAPAGSLHVKLGAESILEVLPVDTQYGPLILGIVVPSLLPAATIQVVGSSLQRVVNGPVQKA